MTVTFKEQGDSQEYRGGTYLYRYMATGTTDPGEVYQAALQQLPLTLSLTQGGKLRDDANISIVPEKDTVDTVKSKAIWRVEVPYSYRPSRQAVDTQIIRVDTTGGTDHIYQSIKTRAAQAIPANYSGTVQDYGGAINVSKKGVEGCDIVVPIFNFTVECCYNLIGRTFNFNGVGVLPWLNDIYSLTGQKNSAKFSATDSFTGMNITLMAGQCLYRGATMGASRSDGALEIVHNFGASPDKVLYGGANPATAGSGWDYLWRLYRDVASATPPVVVKKPIAEYLEQVYQEGDFGVLRIKG